MNSSHNAVYNRHMTRGIDDIPQKCEECGRECINRRSLGNHVAKSHPDVGDLRTYCLRHVTGGVVPKCTCGCGQEVSWHKVLYRFNDYVNGHNEAGFRAKQPVFTPEQIAARSEKIREAYRAKGDVIKKKISSSVSEALHDSGRDFSDYFKKKWNDETFKNRQKVSRLASWTGEAGQTRREKVFTQEFGRKIAAANMSRDVKRTSKAEAEFVDKLREICPDVVSSKWFNFEEKTWCADAWIPSTNTLVEFDGVYWHGLDRTEKFDRNQLVNMTNDLVKNRLARERGLNLVRVGEDSLWREARTIDDVVSIAHHVVQEGTVVRDATPRLEDDTVFLARDLILQATQEKGKEHVEENYLQAVKDFLRAYVDYWGWFYPTCDVDLEDTLDSIERASRRDAQNSTSGSQWLKSRVRSYWDVDRGPSRSFLDDKSLTSVVKYRLGLNDSKPYTYRMSDEREIVSNETFDISLREIRNGFLVQRRKVSWFKPVWAAKVYKKYLASMKSPVVWDPSIGFSARMMALASVCPDSTYIGTDPARRMYEDAVSIADELRQTRPRFVVDLRNEGSEKTIIEPGSVDLVFTSPPYFDDERYYDEPGQCWRDYPAFDEWIAMYLDPTMATAAKSVKSTGRVVFNIPDRLKDAFVSSASRSNLSLCEAEEMNLTSDHFGRKRGSSGVKKREWFLSFKK